MSLGRSPIQSLLFGPRAEFPPVLFALSFPTPAVLHVTNNGVGPISRQVMSPTQILRRHGVIRGRLAPCPLHCFPDQLIQSFLPFSLSPLLLFLFPTQPFHLLTESGFFPPTRAFA